MIRKDKFPSPTGVVRYLNSEESTPLDVIHEFQRLLDLRNIFLICNTHEDTQKYLNRLKSIAKKLKSSLPDDIAMKYFLYGSFARGVNSLSKSFESASYSNSYQIEEN